MMSYNPATPYLPQHSPNYYPSSQPQHHSSPPQSRQETTQQRKRPKYTRSKTGCLTCRVKKIKCDETKPSCMRCTHGQRDCAWPEGAPVRRATRKDSLDADGRPSTAGSSISDSSTPPTRDHTPPHLPHSQPLELGLPPLASRRTATSEPFLQLHPVAAEASLRRHGSDRFAYNVGPTSSLLNPLSENTAYATQPRYDNSYIAHPTSRPISGPGIRPGEHIPGSHPGWNVPPLLAPLHHVETYYPPMPVRNMMAHGSSGEQHPHHHHRYQ